MVQSLAKCRPSKSQRLMDISGIGLWKLRSMASQTGKKKIDLGDMPSTICIKVKIGSTNR